ncbi:hypothetical protein TNCT_319121 [Trichonephila clavata]|uniref:Uncharacterized protein n=1 Tax=Trichonephila clavata TaxID=2740835 RepID=A0A8X6KC25_TRICU|nr:hypothetical protein TNCT_319121 [Trichonephila clavata]
MEKSISHILTWTVNVTAFQMKINHDYLIIHLRHIGVFLSLRLPQCGHEMTDANYLKNYTALDYQNNNESQLLTKIRFLASMCRQMALQPKIGVE